MKGGRVAPFTGAPLTYTYDIEARDWPVLGSDDLAELFREDDRALRHMVAAHREWVATRPMRRLMGALVALRLYGAR